MEFWILSFSLTSSSLLSVVRCLLSSFFNYAFERDHVWRPCVMVDKTRWLKIFFRLRRRRLSRKSSLYFPETLHPAFFHIEILCLALFPIAVVGPRYLWFVTFSVSVSSICMLRIVSICVMNLVLPSRTLRMTFTLHSRRITVVACL